MSRIQKNITSSKIFTYPSIRSVDVWKDLSTGTNGYIAIIKNDNNNNLYAGGNFTNAGDISANRIAKWNGSTWSALGSDSYNGVNYSITPSSTQAYAIAFDTNNNVYVGGQFDQAGNLVNTPYIAKWDGTTWSALGSGMNNYVFTLCVDNSNNLYAGGAFTIAGGISVNRIAKWNGSVWSSLGTGLSGGISPSLPRAMVVDKQNNLYVGGDFTIAGGITVNYIAKWNGTTWSALGTGMNNAVNDLTLDANGNLYACGYFTIAGGINANYIAKWDGTTWSALPVEVNNNTFGISYKNNNLYAGGMFTQAGSSNYNYFACWNGSNWNNFNSSVNNSIGNLSVDNLGTVYVAGAFVTIPGRRIAQYTKSYITSPIIFSKKKTNRIGFI